MSTSTDILVLFYGTVAGLATLGGIFLMNKNRDFAVKNTAYLNSFAAGLIVALVFFHLMPEAAELTEYAFGGIFAGFLIFFVLENVIILHSGSEIHFHQHEVADDHPHAHTSSKRLGLMAFSGLGFHSLIDGIILGVGFELSAEIGLLAALAVISHEVPEGITSFTLIYESMPNRAGSLSVLVALATPVGAILSIIFLNEGLNTSVIGILLAIVAGTFLYVAASDLIPQTHAEHNFRNLGAFLTGALFVIAVSSILRI
ncbi:MAG: ZIP family metal transporter [Candidatus Thorarchaeota archaeon]